MEWIRAKQAEKAAKLRTKALHDRETAMKGAGFTIDRKVLVDLAGDREKHFLDAQGGVSGIAASLGSSLQAGLPTSRVALHRACFGDNRLPPKRMKYWIEHFAESISDLTLIILMIGAIITIIFGVVTNRQEDTITGGAILLAVGVVSGVTSTVNYVQEAQFQALAKVKEDRSVTVIRDGDEQVISIYDVVVGDVFVLRAGELLPCDGLVIAGSGIKCDESAMTGESLEISKSSDGDRFLVGGSQVTAGAGRMLVLTTGEDTSYGAIVKALESIEPPATPLQEKLTALAQRIGYIGMGVGVFNLIILIILYFSIDSRRSDGSPQSITILSFFLLSITIVVVAVPEGLPMAVILSLAFSMKRMVKDKVLVRKLNACETMGSATCICSDKTGTLTENRMTVTAGRFFGIQLPAAVPRVAELGSEGDAAALLFSVAVGLNSDAMVKVTGKGAQGQVLVDFVGNKTEGAILQMMNVTLGYDYLAIRKLASSISGREDGAYFIHRENFNSSKKRMTTILSPKLLSAVFESLSSNLSLTDGSSTTSSTSTSPFTTCPIEVRGNWLPTVYGAENEPSAAVLFTKGAAEIVLGLCTTEASAAKDTGGIVPITQERRVALERSIVDLACNGLRTLAIATGKVDTALGQRIASLVGTEQPAVQVVGEANGDSASSSSSTTAAAAPLRKIASTQDAWDYALEAGWLESGLTLLAVVGIRDPPRPEVPAAVAACQRALVRVRMVTGDNIDTARAIAREVGIYKGGVVMEGKQWRALTQEGRKEVVRNLDVLARAIPTDKLLLVQALQELGEVVAVTGDGSNDAPALNAAHVGCAMGIAGTEVAKEAADLVILDDNFASIVSAILWGRAVLENIRKFLSFQLVVNISACLLTVIMACVQGGAATNFPLTPIQLLWINLVMDSFAALALATEPPDAALLKHRPEGRKTPLISPIMVKMIAGQSVFQTILLLFMTLADEGAAIFDAGHAGYKKGGREHLVCVFNTFVFLTVFNKFNARKLHDNQRNVFAGFLHSIYAPIIMAIIFILQALIVEVGTVSVMQTLPISWSQWLTCIAIGLTTLPVGYALRFIETPDPSVVSDEQYADMVAHGVRGGVEAVLGEGETPTTTKDTHGGVTTLNIREVMVSSPKGETSLATVAK